ncbi:MAG: hypothetical protein NTX15_00845 [Candidatus Kapabacteria bacterium]|nr:hypothetical protein [Candidatus Kapabacteria bacterium]
MKKKKNSLGSALIIILASSLLCFVLAIASAIVTGEWLYALAGSLFLFSGGAGVWVVRTLQKKIDGK